MTANDLLTVITQVFFIVLGLLAAIEYIHYRDSTRRDIALMFGTFAILFGGQLFQRIAGVQLWWLSELSTAALLAQPYLLLRLARYYRSIPTRLMQGALAGMLISWALILIQPSLPQDASIITALVMIIYLVVIDGYAMISFVRGAMTTTGVVRQRLRFAAAGSGLFALAFLMLPVVVLIPGLLDVGAPIVLSIAIASATCFYIGFGAPRMLRRTWQLEELRDFLLHMNQKPIVERADVTNALSELCQGANRATGGMISAILQEDEAQKHWAVRYASDNLERVDEAYANAGILSQAKQQNKPVYFRAREALTAEDRRLLETFAAESVLIAPVATTQRNWGLLLVFPRNTPLFVDDDLDMLLLLTRQSATALENSLLIDKLNSRSEQLKEQVKQQSQELEASRVEYRRIIDLAQEGVWEADRDFRTTFVNERVSQMLGYSNAELMSKPSTAFLEPESFAEIPTYQERRRQGVREHLVLSFRRKNGTTMIAQISSTPLFDENGEYAGSVAMLSDITERKRAEEEIMKLNTELEQRVVERTAQLSAVNKELEAFSYSVSHDLRAPLRALDGFSQILLEDYSEKFDEDGLKYLHRIRAGSQRMGQLIDAMIQLSRLTRADVLFEVVNLSEIALSISVELREQSPERQVEFRIQDGLETVGDERMLQIVLMNLFNNAWKFTSKQTQPCIEFGTTTDRGKLAYFVRDNGVGFDMAYSGKLFGAFQRLHGMNEFEGTGIGLATVQRIVHRHMGDIWVEAAMNKGATFYFTLNGQGQENGNYGAESLVGRRQPG